MDLNAPKHHKKNTLFGRRQGRPLSGQRLQALEALLPKITLSENKLTCDHTASPSVFFDKNHTAYWLEIGFGHGEHLAALLRNNPDIGYIGAEPFINGMAAFLSDIQYDPHDNIRVLMDDGMIAAQSLAPNSLDGIYILNPDPWHKKRHHKRRIINQHNLDIFSRILKPGGQLIMTTDVDDLAEWMCTHAAHHPDFLWTAENKNDWSIPPKDWIPTRYETKGAKGSKKMVYLFFEKRK